MFGDKLKELREQKNLKQSEFASILGIGRTTLSHYELNNREPDFETLEKIATYFGVSIDYLLGRTELKTFDEYVFNNDFQTLSEKLKTVSPEVRDLTVNIFDSVFLNIYDYLNVNDLETLSKLHDIYKCIYNLNASLRSNSMAIALNELLEYDAVTIQDKLKILSKYKNDLNVFLDELLQFYINDKKPTE